MLLSNPVPDASPNLYLGLETELLLIMHWGGESGDRSSVKAIKSPFKHGAGCTVSGADGLLS